MARAPKPPALQVLFEPWPVSAGADREGYEVFAGQYLIDALDASGEFKVRGFRAVVAGCTTCRRSDADERVHWPNINDLAPEKPKRRCPQWKKVEAIVKAFGGWEAAHYVELASNEKLEYQPIPQRRRVIEQCPACEGTGHAGWNADMTEFLKCDAGCGSYGYHTKGEVQVTFEGPVRPDRHGLLDTQRRIRA